MRRRGPFCFYAFDLLWLNGSDLRNRPLLEQKRLLRKLLARHPKSVLYVNHIANTTDLFQVVCEQDMEGIFPKQASAGYTPDATTWVKIKNRQYSQAVGRQDFFQPLEGAHHQCAAVGDQWVLTPGNARRANMSSCFHRLSISSGKYASIHRSRV